MKKPATHIVRSGKVKASPGGSQQATKHHAASVQRSPGTASKVRLRCLQRCSRSSAVQASAVEVQKTTASSKQLSWNRPERSAPKNSPQQRGRERNGVLGKRKTTDVAKAASAVNRSNQP